MRTVGELVEQAIQRLLTRLVRPVVLKQVREGPGRGQQPQHQFLHGLQLEDFSFQVRDSSYQVRFLHAALLISRRSREQRTADFTMPRSKSHTSADIWRMDAASSIVRLNGS